jgi:RNase P/RNase MRP subunit POP5
MHGFYVDTERKLITFDVIIDFKSEDIMRMKNAILEKLSSMYGDYDFDIILDNDYSD